MNFLSIKNALRPLISRQVQQPAPALAPPLATEPAAKPEPEPAVAAPASVPPDTAVMPLHLTKPAYESMEGLTVVPGRGRLSFVAVPDAALSVQIEYLARHLAEQPGGKVALVGDHPAVDRLGEQLAGQHPSVAFINLRDLDYPNMSTRCAPPVLRPEGGIGCVVLLCREGSVMRFMRIIVHQSGFEGRVVVPAVHDLEWPTLHYENSRPIVEYVYPGSGTNRFKPCFGHLLDQTHWHNTTFTSFVTNSHLIESSRRSDGTLELPSFEDATEAIYWSARLMDRFQFLIINEYVNPERFKDFDGSLVVLLRDPRDIINSMFWLTRPEVEGSEEAHILRIINGYIRTLPDHQSYAFKWPDARLLVGGFVALTRMSNAFIVRFEDMHANEAAALQKLMRQLGLDPNPFVKFDDEAYRRAAYLGSFEYQTGGKRKRNEDHKTYFSSGGVLSVVRKGGVGDWRSSFTPAAVERFKELTGDGLVRLGYEKDTTWGL